MKIKKYISVAVLSIFISGCAPKVKMPTANTEDTQPKQEEHYKPTASFNPDVDSRYKLKPEPYSLASKQKDPELLGPQSTLKNNPLAKRSDDLDSENYNETTSSTKAEVVSEVYDNKETTTTTPKKSVAMSKSECIGMIGEAKFNEYVQKFGGEGAAIRRCVILKRLRG